MLTNIAAFPVVLAGIYLIGLGILTMLSPRSTERFLARHASTAVAHVVELTLRLTIGVAMLYHAPYMRWSPAFSVAGWILVITSLTLLVLPWRWHQRFARWSVPQATRRLPLLAVGATGAGLVVLFAVLRGP